MSAILDILIVVIIGVTILFAVKNGFVKTVLSAASFLIALVVAFLFVSPVRDAFLESGMAVKVRSAVDESITSFVTGASAEQEELPEFLTKLEFIGIDRAELAETPKRSKTSWSATSPSRCCVRWRPLPHSCCSTLAQCWSCGWPPICSTS